MKKVFIAYSDKNLAFSLQRIGKEAKTLGIFDEVILYTPEDLPDYVKKSPLMKYKYGGGYWSWKPCLIYETLKNYEQGTVVCYVDAGCSLKQGIEWTLYFELMKEWDTLCFKYREEMPEWEQFGTKETRIDHWGKKNLLLFLDDYIGSSAYRKNSKIWGGALFFKSRDNEFLKQWMDITLNHSDMIIDPSPEELKDQYPYFAQHKHDQVVLTALAYHHRKDCIVLPELSETCGERVSICASRYRCATQMQYYMEITKRKMRTIMGGRLYNLLKRVVK